MSTCHKMNYSSVPNKRNKRSPLLFFLDKIFGSPFSLSCSYQDTPLQTYKLTHTPLINFSFFFREKIRKMRFKLSDEVRYQWLFFLYRLTFIVLSQYTCRFFVNLHHLNQIRQMTPPLLLILFCWIFQSHPLIKIVGYSGPKNWGLIFWKLQNISYLN